MTFEALAATPFSCLFCSFQAILGTEMSRHMKMLEQLNAITDVDAAFLDPPGQALLIKTLVHSADLSGQALYVVGRTAMQNARHFFYLRAQVLCVSHANDIRSFDVAARWGDAVLIEFADQSRREAEAGVPLTVGARGFCREDCDLCIDRLCRWQLIV